MFHRSGTIVWTSWKIFHLFGEGHTHTHKLLHSQKPPTVSPLSLLTNGTTTFPYKNPTPLFFPPFVVIFLHRLQFSKVENCRGRSICDFARVTLRRVDGTTRDFVRARARARASALVAPFSSSGLFAPARTPLTYNVARGPANIVVNRRSVARVTRNSTRATRISNASFVHAVSRQVCSHEERARARKEITRLAARLKINDASRSTNVAAAAGSLKQREVTLRRSERENVARQRGCPRWTREPPREQLGENFLSNMAVYFRQGRTARFDLERIHFFEFFAQGDCHVSSYLRDAGVFARALLRVSVLLTWLKMTSTKLYIISTQFQFKFYYIFLFSL